MLTLSGVGAQHQNARAERAIQTIANLVPPDFDENEGVQLTPNMTPAPEGAHQRTRGKAKEYPPAVWRRGADGKMERVSLSVICQEYK